MALRSSDCDRVTTSLRSGKSTALARGNYNSLAMSCFSAAVFQELSVAQIRSKTLSMPPLTNTAELKDKMTSPALTQPPCWHPLFPHISWYSVAKLPHNRDNLISLNGPKELMKCPENQLSMQCSWVERMGGVTRNHSDLLSQPKEDMHPQPSLSKNLQFCHTEICENTQSHILLYFPPSGCCLLTNISTSLGE